jgi:protein TonB
MKQLVLPAVLAIAIHGGIFLCKLPWAAPAMPAPQSRSVNISLVKISKPKPPAPVPQEVVPPPEPAPQPKPKPVAKPKPVVKPIPKAPPPVKPYKSTLPQMAGIKPLAPLAEPPPELPPAESSPVSDREQAADQPDSPAPADTTEGARVQVSVPLYELNPPIPYPRAARRRNCQGTAILDVLVTREGRVADIRLHQSSGYALLDRSAETHVKTWRFQPARRGGQTIEMWVKVPVRYELNN